MPAVQDKELLHCLAFAYIQEHPNATTNDFFAYMVSAKLKKDVTAIIPSGSVVYKKGDVVTAKMISHFNINNSKPKNEIIDDSYIMIDPMFHPGKEYVGSNKTLGAVFDYNKLKSYRLAFKFGGKSFTLLGNKVTVEVAFTSMKKLFVSNIISSHEYYALNSENPFYKAVKDEPLTKIISALDFKIRPDILNPVDFYIVAKHAMNPLLSEISQHITKASPIEILENIRLKKHNYRTIINKYFAKKELFGVSSKLLSNKSIESKFKIIGTTSFGKNSILGTSLEKDIDPYTRLLRHIIENPDKMNSIIEKTININFNKKRFDAHLHGWSIEVDFDFSSFPEISTDKTTFLLEFLGDAGYNGKYIKHHIKGTSTTTPFVGGFQELNMINDLFFNMYKDGFKEDLFLKKRIGNISNPELVNFLSKKTFYSPAKIKEKFKAYKISEDDIGEYFAEATINLLGECGDAPIRYMRVDEHKKEINYRKAQFAFFITEKEIRDIVKKKIFLTVYGVMTKKGYQAYTDNEILSLIRKKYSQMEKKGTKITEKDVVAEFSSAPYLMVGSLI